MIRTDFEYESRDGVSRIHAIKWEPETEAIGVLILVHGMAETLDRYEEFAEFMCDKGFVVAGNEHLGHGKSVGKNPKGYFCRRDPATVVVRDVHRLKKKIQSEYPSLPIFIFGHSMGSLITRNYITKYGSGINGTVISGTLMMNKGLLVGMGFICKILQLVFGPKHPSPFLDKAAFGTYCNKIDSPRTPFDWLTRDVAIVNKYIADPDCGFVFTINGFYTLKELMIRLHKEKLLNQIPKDLPVLFVYGGQDPCGEYGEAVRRVYKQYVDLGIKDVTEKEYQDDRHEILNELDKADVMTYVYDWIRERM